MKTTLLYLTIAVALAATSATAQAVVPAARLSESALSTALAAGNDAPATPVAAMPLELTAMDLVSKVYGVLDTGLSQSSTVEEAGRCLNLTPSADSTGLWLESADGYVVSYYGMKPDISAVAHFDEKGATDYCYFFLFPYAEGNREFVNHQQALFSGCLLQEMSDIGLIIGVPDSSDAIFEAFGSHADKLINVRLTEEELPGDSGLFILMLGITPRSFTHYDFIMAENRP